MQCGKPDAMRFSDVRFLLSTAADPGICFERVKGFSSEKQLPGVAAAPDSTHVDCFVAALLAMTGVARLAVTTATVAISS